MTPSTHKITLESYYQWSWFLLLVTAFSLVSSARVFSPWMAVISILMCFWVLLPDRFNRNEKSRLSPLIFFLFMLILWIEGAFYFIKEERVVGLVLSVLLSLLPLFLYRKQKMFGSWIAFLVVSVAALIGVIIANAIFEYLLFILFLVLLVFNLNAVNLILLAGPSTSRIMLLPPGHFRQFLPSLAWGMVAATSIFLFFPRTPALNNPFGIREKGVTSGYTGKVELKSEAKIGNSSQLAFIVESTDLEYLKKIGPDLYFRGNTLDYFDGNSWSESVKGESPYRDEIDLRYTTQFSLHPQRFKIYREPHNTRAIIYPNLLLAIKAPLGLLSGLNYDSNGNLSRGHNEEIRYSYEVMVTEGLIPQGMRSLPMKEVVELYGSRLNRPALPLLPTGRELNRFLQIPYQAEKNNFFYQWVKEVGTMDYSRPLSDLFDKLGRHFRKEFIPSMEYRFNSDDAFQGFLTTGRKGHCEYFATATALFLRAYGIPTRVVLGYHGGSYNAVSKTLEVKELNAHAWVEAYFPGVGWFTVDATPVVPLAQMSQMEAYLNLYLGAAKFWANRYVVDYNNMTQRNLVKSIATVGGYKINNLKEWKFEFNRRSLLVILAFGIVIFQFIRKKVISRRIETLPKYYLKFLSVMKNKGIERSPCESYATFHKRVLQADMDRELVERIHICLEVDLYSKIKSDLRDQEFILKNLG